jgi:hypothetical protein
MFFAQALEKGEMKMKNLFNSSFFLRRGEGRFYLCKKGKEKKFTLYFLKTYRDWALQL